jgi:hypothetical protein
VTQQRTGIATAPRSPDVIELDEQSAEAVRVAAYAGPRLG